MERSSEIRECPHCGARETSASGRSCGACGRDLGAKAFAVLAGGGGADFGGGEPPEVQLVREYKGPTVDEVLGASPSALDLLPGRVLSMEQSVATDDLQAADEQLSLALGMLHVGPGHRRWRLLRPGSLLWTALWLWFAVLVVVLAWFAL